MEVVRSSDIAWLVLGYLRDHHLEKASKMFCKTSPYLKEEYDLIQKGYRSVCLGYGTLSDILREYCEIKSKVVQFIESLPVESKDQFSKQSNLLEKLSVLVKAARRDLVGKIESEASQSRAAKRRKTVSSDTSDSFETTQEKDLPGYSPPPGTKRRRISPSFLLLTNNKAQQDNDNVSSDEDEKATTSGSTNSHSSEPETVISLTKSSKQKQSVPKKQEELAPKNDIPVPSFPTIFETLLENTEFQNKLVANINKVLSIGPPPSTEKINTAKKKPNSDLASDEIDLHFEEMIQNILNETEKDPTFHEVVQDILLSNVDTDPKPTTNNQSTQCSPQQIAPEPVASTSCYEPPLKDRLRSRKLNTSTEAAVESTQNTSLETPGKLSAADSDLKIGSFLTDPNYSFSKLIVLNPNDTMTTSTPLISDSLLASAGNQLLNSYSENVFIDMNTGQMSIPLYMTNDVNTVFFNTELGQQLSDVSLPATKAVEPASVEQANVLPEVITSQPAQENRIVTSIAGNVESLSQMTASLDSARILRDKETPSVNVPNNDMIRSLSTPRRRASHVRVLNFTSPSNLQSEGVIVPKSDAINKKAIAVPEPQMHPIVIASGSSEADAVINDIPIIGENLTVVNESSNSSSNGFAKTSSNVTVLQKNLSETPKRKSEGRRSCARMLSRSGSEENESLLQRKERMKKQQKKKSPTKKLAASKLKAHPKSVKKPTSVKKTSGVKKTSSVKKSNSGRKSTTEEQSKTPEKSATKQLNSLEEWQRMRSIAPAQWDQHLREISAKSSTGVQLPHSNKKKKRKIGENKPQTPLNTSSSLDGESIEKSNCAAINSESASGKNSAKKNLINFKFVTPLKLVKDSKSTKTPGKYKLINEVTLEKIIEPTDKSEEGQQHTSTTLVASAEQNPAALEQRQFPQTLLENRTNNMALLLDTPYKTDPTAIPKTPCFLVPSSNDTPITRMMNSFRDQISMCKNPDLPTPNFAITPGAGMTPIEKETPRSGHWSSYTTDYSSGGSYYKPDESEDLDKHFDALLTAERSKRKLKGKENKAELKPETQEIAAEESSSHSIVTIISATKEIREHQIQCPQILEKVPTPKKLTAPPHYTLREGLPEDSKSDVSTSSSSSSSSSSSTDSSTSSPTNITDSSDDVSWVEPEPIVKEQLLAEDGEIRYPLRSWITPKKTENEKLKSPAKSPANSHLKEVVDKIKATQMTQKRQLQMSDLEAKRLRMKQKLQNDFSTGENKRTVAMPVKKAKARNKKESSETVTSNNDKNDVLKALNLSVKKTERTQSVTSSIATESEEFPRLRVDEDSKESSDTIEIRNAAYVLTNFSKAAAETAMQKPVDSAKLVKELATAKEPAITMELPIAKKPARKGRPKKDPVKQAAKIVVSPKMYPPHKPITRRDLKAIHPDEPVVPNKTADILATVELSQKTEDVSKKILQIKVQGQSASPKSSPNRMSTRSKLVESQTNISPDPVSKQTEIRSIEQQPIIESSSSDQEEDEDPYDACTSITIDENDKLRYHCVSHETLSGREAKSKPTVRRANDLSTMVMNIFLEGVPHQLVVTDEIELFGNTPMTRNVKSAAAVINEKKPGRVTATRKKTKVPVTARRKKQLVDEIEPDEPQDSLIPISPIQPKITIKYKNRTAKDDQIKLKTEKIPDKVRPDSTSEMQSNAASSSNIENIPSSSTVPIEAQKPIKIEDINAVLSHLHGI